jgi:hypothetical protein
MGGTGYVMEGQYKGVKVAVKVRCREVATSLWQTTGTFMWGVGHR